MTREKDNPPAQSRGTKPALIWLQDKRLAEKRSEESVEPLLKAANEAAQHVQRVYLTFLLLTTYIAIIIWSTTDEQLLKVSSVNLPLLDVPLPIVQFYTFVPWLFFVLHFNLLLQLYLLAHKLRVVEKAMLDLGTDTVEEQETAKLFPFPFSHMLIGRYQQRIVRPLLGIVVWTTVVFVPLAILTYMQVRFLPYHDGAITWNQRVAVLADAGLLGIFSFIIPMARRSDQETQRESHGDEKVWIRWLRLIQIGWRGFYIQRGSFALVVFTSLIFCLFSYSIAVLPGEEKGWPFGNLTEVLFEGPSRYIHRNLRLSGKILVDGELTPNLAGGLRSQDGKIKEESMKDVAGLNLRNRDLRSADLRGALLPKVDLRGANLDNARLDRADLSGADLSPLDANDGASCVEEKQEENLTPRDQTTARLIDAKTVIAARAADLRKKGRFCFTSLRGANLSGSTLENSRLPYARLEGAILQAAQLSKTNLFRARLQNANLSHARLHEADLRRAQLQGAVLTWAQLHGADLSHAQLQVMHSIDMEAQGANLEGAHLQGAHLLQANFQGANLRGALLQGTRLETVRFQGADLKGAQLQGADLSAAQLQGAYLRLSGIGGADFRAADLSLSNMADVDREPLTREAYNELVKIISQTQVSKERRDNALRRLTRAVGQHDTLEKAIRGEYMLCGWKDATGTHEPAFFKGCIPGVDFERYEQKLVPFLGKLGCSDPYIAQGLYNRAVSPDASDAWSSLGAELAKQLLDPSCEGGKSLSEAAKTRLQQVIEAEKYRRSKRPRSKPLQ
jgi:uncharacterized protein YjbI with pentapeptide repeats